MAPVFDFGHLDLLRSKHKPELPVPVVQEMPLTPAEMLTPASVPATSPGSAIMFRPRLILTPAVRSLLHAPS